MNHRYCEETALVSGAPAWLLSLVLSSSRVVTVLANPPTGVDRADVAATIAAINRASRAYINRLEVQRRDNATTPNEGMPQSATWTTQQAATYLQLSRRRVQEIASELGGERVGREWRLPEMAVREYAERNAAA